MPAPISGSGKPARTGSASPDAQATPEIASDLVPASSLRAYLDAASADPKAHPELTPQARKTLEEALAGGDQVSLEGLGPETTAIREAIENPSPPSTAQKADAFLSPSGSPGLPNLGTLLGPGVELTDDPMLKNLPGMKVFGDTLVPRGTSNTKVDPAASRRTYDSANVLPEVQTLLENRAGRHDVAEQVAKAIAAKLGPYSAANSPKNLQKIIDNMNWIADTWPGGGIRYDQNRDEKGKFTTQSPNETLSTRSGVCRDIHTAVNALLGSLAGATKVGGTWLPGSPSGHEEMVQTFGFATPREFHAYAVYRDPLTRGWDGLEYRNRYEYNLPTAVEAFRALPHDSTGFTRYSIGGWDDRPVTSNRAVDGAGATFRDLISSNPGQGKPGQVDLQVGADRVQVTGFVTKNLSVTAATDPTKWSDGADAAVKLNWAKDFQSADSRGDLQFAVAAYTTPLEVSSTGVRAASNRSRYQLLVLGVRAAGHVEGDLIKKKVQEFLGDNAHLFYALDGKATLGLPFAIGGRVNGGLVAGATGDFSELALGAKLGASYHGQINPNLGLDVVVLGEASVDGIGLSTSLVTGEGKPDAQRVVADAVRARVGLGLTYKPDNGLTTRLVVSGTALPLAPFDNETTARAEHQLRLEMYPESKRVVAALVAQGAYRNDQFNPVTDLGVTVNYNKGSFTAGVGVQVGSPDGAFRNLGEDVRVYGNVGFRF